MLPARQNQGDVVWMPRSASELSRRPRRLRIAGDVDPERLLMVGMGGFFAIVLLPGVLLSDPQLGRVLAAAGLTVACGFMYRLGRFGVDLSCRGVHVRRLFTRNDLIPWESVATFRFGHFTADFGRKEIERVVVVTTDGETVPLTVLSRPVDGRSQALPFGAQRGRYSSLDDLVDQLNAIADDQRAGALDH